MAKRRGGSKDSKETSGGREGRKVPKFVSMEWALKRLLRSKANFDVLEGFLSELLDTDVAILEILESESNRLDEDDKQNRVDLKAKLRGGEIVIIEVQTKVRAEFLPRLLYGTSRVVVEHLRKGESYDKVARVISVAIMRDTLAGLSDYVFYGRTEFTGANNGSPYLLTPAQNQRLGVDSPSLVFPRYYLLAVNRFDEVARTTLDEWIYFLKTQDFPEKITARGLARAKVVFEFMNLPQAQRVDYDHEFMREWALRDEEQTAREMAELALREGLEKGLQEGREKGLLEGRQEGRQEGLVEAAVSIARRLLPSLDDASVATATGLSVDEVRRLRDEAGTES